jgi:DsbC/DsbD-like thiol-disulfide interchange protein/cytochrome c biogenesis protein CcdA
MRRWLGTLLLAIMTFTIGHAARGEEEGAVFTSPHDTLRLVAESDTVDPGQPLRLGLFFHLAPGWHIYWKNPGAAGAPPALSLTLPPGWHAGPLDWPVPRRITEGPVTVFGYEGDVLLPFTLTPDAAAPSADAPLTVTAEVSWLVCAKLCVPEQAKLRLTLPRGTAAPGPYAALFTAVRSSLPEPFPGKAVADGDGHLYLEPAVDDPLFHARKAYFFPERADLVTPEPSEIRLVRRGRGLVLPLTPASHYAPGELSGVVVFDRDPQRGFSLTATPGPLPPAPLAAAALGPSLLSGFLGGLILNLMPCVFPVLALKAFALLRWGGARRHDVLTEAFAYTLGIVFTFTLLGSVMFGLRAAGGAAGWGFQFQSPVFTTAVGWVLFGIGLNLSGVYTLRLSLPGVSGRGGWVGAFSTGLLAVLVATPCTAPFMGAAIAAALALPPLAGLAIFVAMGLGLAAPYLALAFFPRLAALLPRPGRWMETLRQILAFPLYGASVWLAWVVAKETGANGVLVFGAGLVVLGFAAWSWAEAGRALSKQGRRIAETLTATAALAAAALLSGMPARALPQAPAAPGVIAGVETVPFSTSKLEEALAKGEPVFVNVTAAWCLSCLVNERMVLTSTAVAEALAARHVVYMVGDWTAQDPSLTAFLHRFGRDGVPLYVLFTGDKHRDPVVLPQILTETTVLAALEHVGTKEAAAAPLSR